METKKTVAEEFGNPTYRFAPVVVTRDSDCTVDCYSASNFNQLCQDFDRLNEKYLALKKACDEAEPVNREFQGRDGKWYPFLDERHYKNTVADGSWSIRDLFTHPAPVIASEQKPHCWKCEATHEEDIGGEDEVVVCFEESQMRDYRDESDYAITPLFTTPPNTADIEQRCREAFVTKFKQHVGGDGYFWLHELEDFCEDGKWREYL